MLRPCQTKSMTDVIAHLAESPILVLPTGGGKTYTAAETVHYLNVPTLWLAHRAELINQAADTLESLDLACETICASVDREPRIFGPYGPATYVASPQTLTRRSESTWPVVRLIVADECHHFSSAMFQQIRAHYPSVPIIGLTATPFRLDGRGLGDAGFGHIVVGAYADELCANGTLHAPRVFAGHMPDMRKVGIRAGDYEVAGSAAAMSKPEIIGDAVEMWKKHAAGRRTVGFTVNIAHSMEQTQAFRDAGIAAAHLDGKTPTDERRAILAALRAGEIKVVMNCMVLTEGWDLPSLECAVILRPTASLNLHLQMIGRIMRSCPDKSGAIVLDHAGNHHVHGRVTRRLEYSLGGKITGESEPLGLRRCRACQFLFDPSAEACPECGWMPENTDAKLQSIHYVPGELEDFMEDFRYRREFWNLIEAQREAADFQPGWSRYRYFERFNEWPLVAFGELIDPVTAGMDEKREIYRGLIETARTKGFKDGWASWQYRKIFGVWPSGFVTSVRGNSAIQRWAQRYPEAAE
ncbi:MAG: DEAD/DEAH box helicase [Bryobacteraceae bacterium]